MSYVTCHLSHVNFHLYHFTSHLLPTPTATATIPLPVNFPTLHIWLVYLEKNPKPLKMPDLKIIWKLQHSFLLFNFCNTFFEQKSPAFLIQVANRGDTQRDGQTNNSTLTQNRSRDRFRQTIILKQIWGRGVQAECDTWYLWQSGWRDFESPQIGI